MTTTSNALQSKKIGRLILSVGLIVIVIVNLCRETAQIKDCTTPQAAASTSLSWLQSDESSSSTSSSRRKLTPLHELTRSFEAVPTCSNPMLTPVLDKIVTNETAYPHQKIPRTIHVAWVRRSPSVEPRCLPADFTEYTNQWKRQFPSYSFYFHDDDAVDALFQQDWPEFPQLRKLMDSCVQFSGAVRIDIWRVLILYRYGGFYSDLDAAPNNNVTESMVDPLDSGFFLSDWVNRPTQGMHGMEPRHPIAYYTMNEIMQRLSAMKDISKIKPVFTTGPDALKQGFGTAMGWPKNVFTTRVIQDSVYGKQVRKLSREEGVLLLFKDEERDVVAWNATENVTKRVRVNRLLQTEHWLKTIKKRTGLRGGSCLHNMFLFDEKIYNDTQNELKRSNSTLNGGEFNDK